MMMPTTRHVIVTTTCNTPTGCDKLVAALLDAKVVACVQVSDVSSHYWWKNKKTRDEEYLLTCKTRAELVDAVQDIVMKNHAYETPQFVVLPILGGSEAYLKWIDEVTA